MAVERETTTKRDYAPPRLRIIDLVAEEVLGGGCKLAGGGGPFGDCADTSCLSLTS